MTLNFAKEANKFFRNPKTFKWESLGCDSCKNFRLASCQRRNGVQTKNRKTSTSFVHRNYDEDALFVPTASMEQFLCRYRLFMEDPKSDLGLCGVRLILSRDIQLIFAEWIMMTAESAQSDQKCPIKQK